MATMKDYSNEVTPNWCPGCGHFSVLRALQVAAAKLNIPKESLVVTTGIGCSGRLSGYMSSYGFHGIHGRSLPIAQGIKLANKDLTVIAAGGDGDGFAIGLSHTMHAIRRNIDITYIVLNNQVYGLTKGHTSPLSPKSFKTKSSPYGSVEAPIKPGILALANGAGFIAQGYSAYQEQLIDIIIKAIQHRGFSLVNVYSPCVTYNKINTYQWFRERLVDLDKQEGYIASDYQGAMNTLIETDCLCTGVIYKEEGASYIDLVQEKASLPLTKLDIELPEEEFNRLFEGFK